MKYAGDKMKRIAILAPYVGVVNRGAETFVIELTKKLSKFYDIDVYSTGVSKLIYKNCIVINCIPSPFLKYHTKLYERFSFYRKIVNKFYYIIPDVLFQRAFTKKAFKVIDNNKYDLLFPNNGVWGAKYSKIYRKKTGTPFIYTGHGGIGPGERIILGYEPDYYICLTTKHYNWAKKHCAVNKTQLTIIPNGVNVSCFSKHKAQNKSTKRIISVAALTSFKRHQLSILAISKLNNVDLVILGNGEEKKCLLNLVDKVLRKRCTITSVPYESIKDWYSKSDLFVLPSLEEPFGIVYLEAMASNIPIVAPDDEQRREIIGTAGLFCDVENIDEYAKTISQALSMEWGDIPYERAKLFDWGLVSNKYMNLIESLF